MHGSNNNVTGNFQEVEGHPKEKLPTDLSFMIALCVGMGSAALAVRGKETKVINTSSMFNSGTIGAGPSISSALTAQVITALSQVQNITENTVGNVGSTAVGLDMSNLLLSFLEDRRDYIQGKIDKWKQKEGFEMNKTYKRYAENLITINNDIKDVKDYLK